MREVPEKSLDSILTFRGLDLEIILWPGTFEGEVLNKIVWFRIDIRVEGLQYA